MFDPCIYKRVQLITIKNNQMKPKRLKLKRINILNTGMFSGGLPNYHPTPDICKCRFFAGTRVEVCGTTEQACEFLVLLIHIPL
jgi:hypothetical protein